MKVLKDANKRRKIGAGDSESVRPFVLNVDYELELTLKQPLLRKLFMSHNYYE